MHILLIIKPKTFFEDLIGKTSLEAGKLQLKIMFAEIERKEGLAYHSAVYRNDIHSL